MRKPKKFSLSQASKEVGKSKPTISKAIKTGRLSAKKVGVGYEIDASELYRVYPKEEETLTVNKHSPEVKVALLELELEKVKEQLSREREIAEEYRIQFDKANNLLQDHRKGFWKRITGG